MNLAQFRAKANELRQSLEQILNTLHVCPDKIEWAAALDHFSVLNVQYYNLVGQLRPMLKHWAVHPKVANQENNSGGRSIPGQMPPCFPVCLGAPTLAPEICHSSVLQVGSENCIRERGSCAPRLPPSLFVPYVPSHLCA
mmetsp:Transcript_28581/g.68095  ORF Transcript_28581/g.68095 Transcript_28581/m.68095 type:complete len:140 (-) Transcript_28581:475-894(-)